MKIIQIRGNNGTGKTTMVRGYIESHENELISVKVGGRTVDCHKVGNNIVIGRYDKNECGGCDASIKTGDELKETIAKVTRLYHPDAIVFEGVMYGKSFDFTYQIYRFALKVRAEFLAICLEPPFETTLERIYKRNGGKDVNISSLEKGYRASILSNNKLELGKIPIKRVNTAEMDEKGMRKALEEFV